MTRCCIQTADSGCWWQARSGWSVGRAGELRDLPGGIHSLGRGPRAPRLHARLPPPMHRPMATRWAVIGGAGDRYGCSQSSLSSLHSLGGVFFARPLSLRPHRLSAAQGACTDRGCVVVRLVLVRRLLHPELPRVQEAARDRDRHPTDTPANPPGPRYRRPAGAGGRGRGGGTG
jgi:hypothetical protein